MGGFDSTVWKHWEGITEGSCRNDFPTFGVTGALSLCLVFMEQQWLDNALSDQPLSLVSQQALVRGTLQQQRAYC